MQKTTAPKTRAKGGSAILLVGTMQPQDCLTYATDEIISAAMNGIADLAEEAAEADDEKARQEALDAVLVLARIRVMAEGLARARKASA